MPLDPQAQTLLDAMTAIGLGSGETLRDVERVRELFRTLRVPAELATPVHEVTDRAIPGPAGEIPVRVYRPAAETGLPLLVLFHGGGWVIGDLDTHDGMARDLSNAAGCVTVSVDYRLAPEHCFPAAVDDCFAALRWAVEHASELGADATRVAVAGDSAGGNLAAVMALLARDSGGPALVHQLLVYPVTDREFDSASMVDNATGYFLERDDMRFFYECYLAGDASLGDDPRVSPCRAPDLSGLPPATVITAEYDPLRDQGEAYATRLAAAGVAVDLQRYDGMFHGFFSMIGFIDGAKPAFDRAVAALRAAYGTA